jgi:hypothetical protein
LPQAGFAKGSDGDVAFDWHELHALPTPEEVGNRLKLAVGETYRIMIQGAPLAQAVAALEAKGFRDLPQPTEQAPFTGVARAQMTFIIGSPELRAITKMALCYLAATQGPSVARMPQFNDARRYVVAGVEPSTPLVATIANPWDVRRESDGRRPSGHFMALQSFRGQLVVAQVCLFLKLRYVVYLARGGFALPVNFSAGHFFDRDLHRVTPIPPPPLLPSPPRSSARRRGPARILRRVARPHVSITLTISLAT